VFERRATAIFVVTRVACFAGAGFVSIVSAAEPSNEDAAIWQRAALHRDKATS